MIGKLLKTPSDAKAGEWVESAVRGNLGTVGGCVPRDFDSYVRLFHPATTIDGAPVGWAEVAATTKKMVHPLMQWHAIAGSPGSNSDSSSLWEGGDPEPGYLIPQVMNPLCNLLMRHTAEVAHCFFGLLIDQVWFTISADKIVTSSQKVRRVLNGGPKGSDLLSASEIGKAHFQLHKRRYVALEGPLSAAKEGDQHAGLDFFSRMSPSLLWPLDKMWFLASDTDLDSTIVAGGSSLIQAIIDSPDLEACRVSVTDSLTFDSDRINLPDKTTKRDPQ